MTKVTFDSNCVFLLDEKNDLRNASLRQLIGYHNQGKITIQVPLIMAYENRLGEIHGRSLDRYRDSWRKLEIILKRKNKDRGFDRDPKYLPRYAIVPEPELYPSGELYPAGETIIALFKKIKDIIHPEIDFEGMLLEYRKEDPEAEFAPEWRSAYIDIHICVNHIISNADILLSADGKDISRNARELERCGAKRVRHCSIDNLKEILREIT